VLDLVLVLSSLALGPAISASPSPAVNEPPPLRLTSCRLASDRSGPRGPVQQVLVIAFANERDAPADVAQFTVANVGGVAKAFTARGSFTKGVLVADRILPEKQVPKPSGDRGSDCVLTYVHFTDGSFWGEATP
jgi:hypothetical protein